MGKTINQIKIEEFMKKAGQDVPDNVTIPDPVVRLLRARLILEEAFETVHALGIDIWLDDLILQFDEIRFEEAENRPCDLEGVVDGCADISVVTIGTLSAFGVADSSVIAEVNEANLRKFGPGGFRREDGKWIKPSDWQPPNLIKVLRTQGWEG